ncbi:hypothetical protein AB0I30_01755 [Nocardia tengchongensis]|uniref:hypothetical protein n=1 Tax=Nocardia tengchongensis TaxID=2055889 RepID=UPI0033D14B60
MPRRTRSLSAPAALAASVLGAAVSITVAGCGSDQPVHHHKVVLQASSTYGATMSVNYFSLGAPSGTLSTTQSHWSVTLDDTSDQPFYTLTVDSGANPVTNYNDHKLSAGNGIGQGTVVCRVTIDGKVVAEQTNTYPRIVAARCVGGSAKPSTETSGGADIVPGRTLAEVIAKFPAPLRAALPDSNCKAEDMSSGSANVHCTLALTDPSLAGITLVDNVIDSFVVFAAVNGGTAAHGLDEMKSHAKPGDEVIFNPGKTIGVTISAESAGHYAFEYDNTETGLTVHIFSGVFATASAARQFLARVGLDPTKG